MMDGIFHHHMRQLLETRHQGPKGRARKIVADGHGHFDRDGSAAGRGTCCWSCHADCATLQEQWLPRRLKLRFQKDSNVLMCFDVFVSLFCGNIWPLKHTNKMSNHFFPGLTEVNHV